MIYDLSFYLLLLYFLVFFYECSQKMQANYIFWLDGGGLSVNTEPRRCSLSAFLTWKCFECNFWCVQALIEAKYKSR